MVTHTEYRVSSMERAVWNKYRFKMNKQLNFKFIGFIQKWTETLKTRCVEKLFMQCWQERKTMDLRTQLQNTMPKEKRIPHLMNWLKWLSIVMFWIRLNGFCFHLQITKPKLNICNMQTWSMLNAQCIFGPSWAWSLLLYIYHRIILCNLMRS